MRRSIGDVSRIRRTWQQRRSTDSADIKQTQWYLNITDEELRKAMTGVWERRRQLRAVSQ